MFENIRSAAFEGKSLSEIAYRHGVEIAQGAMLLRACLAESPPETSVLETINTAIQAKFPVRAKDLIHAYQGPALGARLAQLEAAWIASNFHATQETLLDMPDT